MNDPFIGSQIASYRIERLLGRGGMASIYFAWNIQDDRPVALKVLDERHSGAPSSIQRFIHEAQAIASWQHPNIVRVYEAGEDQGIYFYAMEFIRGLDLAQLLRQYMDANQLLSYGEVLRIGWAVASALDYAHQRGIVHRDVKPSNVLISVDGRVLLSDFGLVMDLTRGTLGETFGSPHYIAPEQARNSAGAVPQSDVYSLGVMLYEMLTGATPFDDTSPTTLALKHLTEAPPLPRALNPRLSPAVEAVLLRVLMKSPRERYASGRELMSALDRALVADIGGQADANMPLPLPPEVIRFKARRDQPGQPIGSYPAAPQPAAPHYASQNPPVAATSRHQIRANPSFAGGPPTGTRSMGSAPAGGYAQTGAVPLGQGPIPVQPAAPPAGSRGIRGLGCAVFVIAGLLLAAGLGAALAFSGSRGAFPLIAWSLTRTPTKIAAEDLPSLTPQVTVTFTPSLTFTATQPPPSETPIPTLTPVPPTPTSPPPTLTVPIPLPSATIAPATVPPPTATPEPNALLTIFRYKDEGIVTVNTGEVPFPLENLEYWDNDFELSGEEWEVELLEPGQCVLTWENDGRVRMPNDLECEVVGELVERQGRTRFWQRTIHVYYNEEEITSCRTSESTCEIEIPQDFLTVVAPTP